MSKDKDFKTGRWVIPAAFSEKLSSKNTIETGFSTLIECDVDVDSVGRANGASRIVSVDRLILHRTYDGISGLVFASRMLQNEIADKLERECKTKIVAWNFRVIRKLLSPTVKYNRSQDGELIIESQTKEGLSDSSASASASASAPAAAPNSVLDE